MIERLLLFGATGDLAGRFVLPALAELREHDQLPHDFRVLGAARVDHDDESFRRHVAAQLDQHATADVSAASRQALVDSLRYRPVDLYDPTSVAEVVAAASGASAPDTGGQPVAAYLGLPAAMFPQAVTALGEAGLAPGSRIVVEKPFGQDLPSAQELNRLLQQVTGDDEVFRVDHALGLATTQNLLAARLANRVLEPLWSSAHIEEIDLLWEETLGLEGRASFYDETGALKDVMQNHLLQVLCLIAMEPPVTLGAQDLRDRKLDVLRSVRPPADDEMTSRTRRARYSAGRLAAVGGAEGDSVPDYSEEDGVDAQRGTETFAELLLELDSWRWAGTRFRLRAGKALAERRKQAVVRFRPAPHSPFDDAEPVRNELRIGLDGPHDVALRLTGAASGPPPQLAPLALESEPSASELSAYGRVLLDALEGASARSVRGDEAEEAWRIVTPVLRAWQQGQVGLEEYPAGSTGPPPLSP